jgi:anti-sigma factor RsiW
LLMSIFTPEDLLLYLYKETSPDQNAAIEAALKQDWALSEKLATLQESIYELDQPLESPRTEVVLKVLSYAREAVETGA